MAYLPVTRTLVVAAAIFAAGLSWPLPTQAAEGEIVAPPKAAPSKTVKSKSVKVSPQWFRRIRLTGLNWDRHKPGSENNALVPDADGTPSDAAASPTSPVPEAVSRDPLAREKTTFSASLQNETPYDLDAVTLELQLIPKDGGPRRTSLVEVPLRGENNAPFLSAMSGTDIAAIGHFKRTDFDNLRGYWIAVRGARGHRHLYPSEAADALTQAIKLDDATKVKTLLAAHSDLLQTKPNEAPLLALHRAARNDSAAVTELLLKAGVPVNEADAEGITPLEAAAQNYGLRVARLLIKAGAKVNSTDSEGETPLHEAVRSCDTSRFTPQTGFIQLLLDNGADTSLRDKAGKKPADLSDNATVRALVSAPPPPATP